MRIRGGFVGILRALDTGLLDPLSADVPDEPLPEPRSCGSDRRERAKKRKAREKLAKKRATIAAQAPF